MAAAAAESIFCSLHSQKAHKNVIINLQPDARTVAHVMDSVRWRMASIDVTVSRAGPARTAPSRWKWCATTVSIMTKVSISIDSSLVRVLV
jgi:hypothetical protein